jgi:hypothetical protein
MGVTPGNLAQGPGVLYVGDFGADEPLDSQVNETPAASAHRDVGGTLGGMTRSYEQTYSELEVDQTTETPERRLTRREAQLRTQLAEVTFDNLILALVGGEVTDGAEFEAFDPDDVTSGDSPEYKSIIFDGFGGQGLRRRVFIRKVLSTENVETAASKEDQSVYPVTFTSHFVGNGIKSWRVVAAKPAE